MLQKYYGCQAVAKMADRGRKGRSVVKVPTLALLTRLPFTTIFSSVVVPFSCDAASCARAGPVRGRRDMAVHKSSAECVREMDIKYPRICAQRSHGAQKRAALKRGWTWSDVLRASR